MTDRLLAVGRIAFAVLTLAAIVVQLGRPGWVDVLRGGAASRILRRSDGSNHAA